MMNPMLAFTGLQLAMALAVFAICVLLMMVILIQKGRGGGLTAAFGGGGGGGGAFGAKTGDAFTVITVVLAAIYLLLTVVGNFTFRPESGVAQAAVQSQPASSGSTGAPAGAQPTGPQQLPPGAIRIDPEKLKTSAAEAIRTGTPADENAPADKTGDAADTGADTGDAADAPGVDDSGAAQPDDDQPEGDQPDDEQRESGDEQP